MAIDLTNDEIRRYYDATHKWIYSHYGKASRCEKCELPNLKYQWSNKSRLYKRERSDWQELCVSCHTKFDITPEFREKMRALRLGKPLHIKPVAMFDIETNALVATFESAVQAQKLTGILRSNICNNLKGLSKSAGGYTWQYVDKIPKE